MLELLLVTSGSRCIWSNGGEEMGEEEGKLCLSDGKRKLVKSMNVS